MDDLIMKDGYDKQTVNFYELMGKDFTDGAKHNIELTLNLLEYNDIETLKKFLTNELKLIKNEL